MPGAPSAPPVADAEALSDLQLAAWMDAVARAAAVPDLRPFFDAPAASPEEMRYRQAVFEDLGRVEMRQAVGAFLQQAEASRRATARAGGSGEPLELARHRLTAAQAYAQAVRELQRRLSDCEPASAGFRALHDYLDGYIAVDPFAAMAGEADRLTAALGAIRYTLRLGGGSVAVDAAAQAEDYAAVIARSFERFRVGAAKDYRSEYREASRLNGLEARILLELAAQHERLFADLAAFAAAYPDPFDAVVGQFSDEVLFYVAIADARAQSERLGQPWCLPEAVGRNEEVDVREAVDVALLQARSGDPGALVRNDIRQSPAERLIVVTGPNQAGKTTFARMWGQLHVLARLGCPVPARAARVRFVDRVDTHFERAERAGTFHGKLKDDLLRIKAIVDRATADSLVVLNELFASTTAADALDLARDVLARLGARGATVVCVTFLWELAEGGGEAVASWSGGVDPADARRRTLRIRRAPPEGRAHTEALAAAYGLTAEALARRLAR